MKMNMKKFTAMVSIGTLVLSLTACGSKNENKTESNKLIVGTEAGFAPYEYMEGDKIVGIDMDIAEAIAEDMGKELEIKNMDFEGALIAVQNGKVDLVAAGVSVDEKRKKAMDFSKEYVNSTEVVVVNKESPAFTTIEDKDGDEIFGDDMNGKIVAVQQGNIADFWVSDEGNVKPSKINRYTKFAQTAEDLKNGKVDCIVMDKYPAEDLVEANDTLMILDGTLFEDKYAIAVKKGNKELLDQINETITRLTEEGKIEEFTANHTSSK